MKNKKSKIIVPALGLILLSTAASISGSVAWFTASRTATVNTGSFAVVKTDGSLASTITSGVGTVVSESTINPVSGNDVGIADVSFNPNTKQLYTDKGNGDESGYREIGGTSSYSTLPATGTTAHDYKINDTTFYAFTWKVTLSYTWGADKTDLKVFFDYEESSMTGTDKETDTGLRIAMIGTRTVVWGGLQTAANLKGVYGTAANNYAAYGTTNLTSTGFSYFASDAWAFGNVAAASASPKTGNNGYAKAVDGDNSPTTRADYLGLIHQANSEETSSIDIYCVAWYEGTDPNVANNKTLGSVTSTIKFYATI